LGDYKRNIAGARDPEVLKLFAVVVTKLKTNILDDVPRIMDAIFQVTIDMITKNFEDFPEHRIRFFEFLRAVNLECFPSLFSIPSEHQKLVVHSVVWAIKHTERNISDTVSFCSRHISCNLHLHLFSRVPSLWVFHTGARYLARIVGEC
jgi:exportin-1